MAWERLISFFGIFFILGIAWLLSNNRKKIKYRIILWGLALQLTFAFLILKTTPGRVVFNGAKAVIVRILAFTDEGAYFLFGNLYRGNSGIVANLDHSNMQGYALWLDSDANTQIDFGGAVIGETDTLEITLKNPGTAALQIDAIQFQDSAQFTWLQPQVPFEIPAKRSLKINFLAQPVDSGKITDEISIVTADSNVTAAIPISIDAEPKPMPQLQVATDRLNLSQFKEMGIIFAIHILPTIIFFASLMGVLYHFGIMQRLVQFMAWIMAKTMGTSGAESLSAASNIFVGQTEAPLVIKPYIDNMTMSELMAIMTGGFATIAGGVMAAYVRFGVDAGHLMAASVMSAPAALVIAKIMFPETKQSETAGKVNLHEEKKTANVIDAAASGAGDGLRLAVNVGAMLMAFISLIALVNFVLGHIDEAINFILFNSTSFDWNLSLKDIFGYVFAPFSFFMGVPVKDVLEVGHLLGTKVSINELVAYVDLTALKQSLTPRAFTIATYALCGFANFSSIAIQVGGIGAVAPKRRSDLARVGLRAMIAGALASWLTATIAGMLL